MRDTLRRSSLTIAGVLIALAASGCGVLSSETEAKGKEALCASATVSVESLRAGGAGAKGIASLIYDLTDDNQVKKSAEKVRDGKADDQTVETLVAWVNKVC